MINPDYVQECVEGIVGWEEQQSGEALGQPSPSEGTAAETPAHDSKSLMPHSVRRLAGSSARQVSSSEPLLTFFPGDRRQPPPEFTRSEDPTLQPRMIRSLFFWTLSQSCLSMVLDLAVGIWLRTRATASWLPPSTPASTCLPAQLCPGLIPSCALGSSESYS